MRIHNPLPTLFAYTIIFCMNAINHSDAKLDKEITATFALDMELHPLDQLSVAVDKYGTWVYLGARNYLYQLSSDLKLQIKCTTLQLNPEDYNWNLRNYKHPLVLDNQNQQLISCNIYNSRISCDTRNISDVSKTITTSHEYYKQNVQFRDDGYSTAVAFIAPFLQDNSSTPLSALYLGFGGGIQIRNLEKTNFFALLDVNFAINTEMNVIDDKGARFLNGFSFQNSSYFLLTGVGYSVYGAGAGYLMKIDHQEKYYPNDPYSYDDIFLACNYSIEYSELRKLQHAYIYEYKNESKAEEKIMFALFNRYKTDARSFGFVVCKYDMNKIQFPTEKSQILNQDLIFHHRGLLDVTAMAVTSINDHLVLFLGTSYGHLYKVSIKGFHSPDAHTAYYYSDITIDEGSPIKSIVQINSTADFLYVMSTNILAKVKTYNCDEYKTLYDCLNVQDPHCGWCFATNKCCLKSNCTNHEQNTIGWISYDIYKYANTSSTLENQLLYTAEWNTTVSLMKSHPFNYSTICSSYKSCSTCVSSDHPCKWLVYKYQCSDEIIWNRNDTVIGANADQIHSQKHVFHTLFPKDPYYCPQFSNWLEVDHYIDIDIHSPQSRDIEMRYKIPNDLFSERFTCEFDIEGNKITGNATLKRDFSYRHHDERFQRGVIYCKDVTLSYAAHNRTKKVQFSILWNGSKPLDNPQNIHFILYKCAYMANRCKTCMELEICRWNAEIEECETNPPDNYTENGQCEDPAISFTPNLGPWEGGTMISIRIYNLANVFPFSWNVTVGDSDTPCTIQPYSPNEANEKLSCIVDGCNSSTRNCSGSIKLITKDLLITSTNIFEFVDPKIRHIKPTQGSTRGGTDLTIYGDYMKAGSKIEVYIGDLECVVFENTSMRLKCVTGPSKLPFKSHVTVKFDERIRMSENFFEYDEHIDPKENVLEVPRGVPTGGPNISLTFDMPTERKITKDEEILFYIQDKQLEKIYYSRCGISTISLIICPTPRLSDIDGLFLNEHKPKLMDYGFKVNTTNGTAVFDLDVFKKYPKFLLYPDSLQYLIENSGNKQMTTSLDQCSNTAFVLGAALFVVNTIFIVYCIISTDRWRKMKRKMNALSMEIVVMSHLVKQVEIEKEMDPYVSDSEMLLQPDGKMLELPATQT